MGNAFRIIDWNLDFTIDRFFGVSGIDGNYPLVITRAPVVITITPFLGNFYGNFA